MKTLLTILLSAVCLITNAASNEPGSAQKYIQQGDELLIRSIPNFNQALKHYLQAVDIDSSDVGLNFKTAVCFLNTSEKAKALPFLERVKRKDPHFNPELEFLLGIAYHLNYEFDKAILSYENYLKSLKGADYVSKSVMGLIVNLVYNQRSQGSMEVEMVEGINVYVSKRIQESLYAKQMVNNPVKAKVINVGSTINSDKSDYSPVITADESVMYFTSRRGSGSKSKTDTTDGNFFEDIYVTYNIDNKWTTPELLGSPLNTEDHDAALALSSDGQKIFKYDAASNNGDILISNLQGDKWSDLRPLAGNINSRESERSVTLSADENIIFFERDDITDGNRDIYITQKLKDGSWSDAEKLGPEINTAFDEDGIFFHPDGKTLYFSSNGHNTIGGFDIFKSVLTNGKWSKAENLGYPINTPDDDIFFVLSADGKNGYYSSVKKDGMGDFDIYKVEIEAPEKTDTLNPFSALTLLTGTITDGENGDPVQANIQITDNSIGKPLSTIFSNSKTGKFIVSLPSGKNYGIAVVKEGYIFHSENFDLPLTRDYEKIKKDIKLQRVTKGSTITLNNIFFDFDKATLRKESLMELDRLYRLMKDNPEIKIQITGHTDNIGSETYNQNLSELRAQEVAYYLMDKGIEKNRIKAIGMGMAKPVVSAGKSNDEAERQKNRRTEFTIIED